MTADDMCCWSCHYIGWPQKTLEQSIFQDNTPINSDLFSPCWIEHLLLIKITPSSSNLVTNFLFYEWFLMDCHFRDLLDFQSSEARLMTASVVHKLSEHCVQWSVYCQGTCVWSSLVLPGLWLNVLTKNVDGCFTRMLWMALNINRYMMMITNSELYGNLPKVSSKVAQRRLRIAGYAQRHPELTLHLVLLWEPLHGRAGRGRPRQTYIDTLRADTGLQDTRDIANIMEHRERWRDIIPGSRKFYPT